MDNNGTYLIELSELKTAKLMEQWQTHNKLSVNVRLKNTKLVLNKINKASKKETTESICR